MKLTFASNDIKAAAALMGGVVESKGLTDVLRSVLISIVGDKASFTGTNQQLTIHTEIPVTSDGDVSFTMYQEDLKNLSGSLPTSIPVEFNLNADVVKALKPTEMGASNALEVKFGKMRPKYPAGNASLFPSMPGTEGLKEIELDGNTVMQMIAAATFAPKADIVPSHISVCLDCTDDSLRVVAGSHHSFFISEPVIKEGIGKRRLLLPPDAISKLRAMKAETGLSLMVPEDQGNHAAFKKDDTTLYVRMLEGTYFPYDQIIPNHPNIVEFEAEEFRTALRMVTTSVGAEKTDYIILNVAGKQVSIVYENHMKGKSGDTDFELVNNSGADISIAFGVEYLSDILALLVGNGRFYHAGAGNKIAMFQDDSADTTLLLMPQLIQ